MFGIKNMFKVGMFVGGALFGTAGVAILKSKDAKGAYTQATAAELRRHLRGRKGHQRASLRRGVREGISGGKGSG